MTKSIIIVDHPVVQHNLAILRDKDTNTETYVAAMDRLSALMAYPLFESLAVTDRRVQTPLEAMNAKSLMRADVVLVSIMRAGNAFLEPLRKVLPTSSVGYVGLARDHVTHLPGEYYFNMPDDLAQRPVFVVDPMLATAGSAILAITKIKNADAKDIRYMCLIAAPEGIKALQEAHPDVVIITAAVDRELNEKKYILPGLGDAGDRYYGTTPKLG